MAKSPNYNPLSSVGANLGQGKDPDAMGDAEENPHNLMDLTSRNTFDLGYFGGDRSMIYFEFIFSHDEIYGSRFIFSVYGYLIFPASFAEMFVLFL